MLRSDYRHFPGYPHGFVTHISLGAIAAAIGAVAIPALVEKEFTAVTFLVLAAQQFREIRNMERETLAQLEEAQLVPRGKDFVEGIARVFESRNYLVMAASLQAAAATFFGGPAWAGLSSAVIIWVFVRYLAQGKIIGDIAEVIPAQPYFGFQGYKTLLMVGDIVIMEVGLSSARKKILEESLGVILKPKDDNARATIHNVGQRQAILHTAATLVGTKREVGEQEWSPLARKNVDTGEVAVFIVPNEPDIKALVQAVKLTPVLESARTTPLESGPGQYAAD